MPLYIKDEEVSKIARELAAIRGVSITEVLRSSLKKEADEKNKESYNKFLAKIKVIQEQVAALPDRDSRSIQEIVDEVNDVN